MENKLRDTRSLALISAAVLFVIQLFGINNFTHVLMLLGYGVLAYSVFKNRKDVVALVGTGILASTGLIQLFMSFSLSNIFAKCLTSPSTVTSLKSNLTHLDKIVCGSLWTSVVAKIKITYAGGSSKVFNRALKALSESI